MKRILTILLTLSMLALPISASAAPFGWTVSASSTDPLMNTAPVGSSILYLWFACIRGGSGDPHGMAAAEFALEPTGGNIFGVVAVNGYLSAGTALDLLLAVGGCPDAPIVAAQLFVGESAAGMEICFVPSAFSGTFATVDCGAIPELYDMDFIGFSSTGGDPCRSPGDLCSEDPVSVESKSWGGVKGLYR